MFLPFFTRKHAVRQCEYKLRETFQSVKIEKAKTRWEISWLSLTSLASGSENPTNERDNHERRVNIKLNVHSPLWKCCNWCCSVDWQARGVKLGHSENMAIQLYLMTIRELFTKKALTTRFLPYYVRPNDCFCLHSRFNHRLLQGWSKLIN